MEKWRTKEIRVCLFFKRKGFECDICKEERGKKIWKEKETWTISNMKKIDKLQKK